MDLFIATALIVPAAYVLGAPAARAGAAALVSALALALALDRRLGGLTGDVYGAAIEIAELVFWAATR
jgi:adenosylcobinamide-GDP ribazoletransferase